ncbi:MAG: hypothetical protein LBL48_06755 [Azoarcus sp.]|nr:hypothetical protein [Azoarcus sp.]
MNFPTDTLSSRDAVSPPGTPSATASDAVSPPSAPSAVVIDRRANSSIAISLLSLGIVMMILSMAMHLTGIGVSSMFIELPQLTNAIVGIVVSPVIALVGTNQLLRVRAFNSKGGQVVLYPDRMEFTTLKGWSGNLAAVPYTDVTSVVVKKHGSSPDSLNIADVIRIIRDGQALVKRHGIDVYELRLTTPTGKFQIDCNNIQPPSALADPLLKTLKIKCDNADFIWKEGD